MLRRRTRRPIKPDVDPTRINDRIRIHEVRVIDQDAKQVGVIPTERALQMARDAALDLVEVAPDARPPVCRIMNYGKFKFEAQKKKKSAKAKQHVVKVKEIKLHPKTSGNDYDYRMKHAREFLEKGFKVKVSMVFRGREMAHQEYGLRLVKKMIEDLKDYAMVEMEPKPEGRNITTVLAPSKEITQHKGPEAKKSESAPTEEASQAAEVTQGEQNA